MSEYPEFPDTGGRKIGKEGLGIPIELFEPLSQLGDNEWRRIGFAGLPEASLIVQRDRNSITIKSLKYPDIFLDIRVDDDILELSVSNSGFQGDEKKKHPYIFVKSLIGESVRYFAERGLLLRHLRGVWNKDDKWDCNYREYDGLFKSKISSEPGLLRDAGGLRSAKMECAFMTWTGGLARELGFRFITQMEETYQDDGVELVQIKILFSKSRAG